MKIYRYITALLAAALLCVVHPLRAQNFDMLGIDASVKNHYDNFEVHSLRVITEAGEKELHEKVSGLTMGWKIIEDSLDAYDKAFDYLRLLQGSVKIVLTFSETVSDVKNSIEGIVGCIEQYRNVCLKKKNVRKSDLVFVDAGRELYDKVKSDINDIKQCAAEIVIFVAGIESGGTHYRIPCTPANMILVMDRVVEILDNLRRHVNECYWRLYTYMRMRTGFWSEPMLNNFDRGHCTADAMTRWRESYNKVRVKN